MSGNFKTFDAKTNMLCLGHPPGPDTNHRRRRGSHRHAQRQGVEHVRPEAGRQHHTSGRPGDDSHRRALTKF